LFVAASVLLAQYGSNAVLKKVRAVAHVVKHENGKRQDFGMDHEVLDKNRDETTCTQTHVCRLRNAHWLHFYSYPGKANNQAVAGVPNLSLTIYPFSISTDEHVPLKCLVTKRISKRTKINLIFDRTLRFLEF